MTVFGIILFAFLLGGIGALAAVLIANAQRRTQLERQRFASDARRGLATYHADDEVAW